MTKKIVLLLLLMLCSSCSRGPVIEFIEKKHDFGTVKKGMKLEYVFTFYNRGRETLVVDRVTGG